MTPRVLLRLLRETVIKWWMDDALHLGAALAFYAVLSIAPLMVVTVTWSGKLVGRDVAQGHFVRQLEGLIGEQGAAAFQTMMSSAADSPYAGTLETLLGVLTLLVGATGAFGELQNALNRIWDVTPAWMTGPPEPWWVSVKRMLQTRLFSLGLIVIFGFLLLVSLIISSILAASGDYLQRQIPGYSTVLMVLNLLISFLVVTAMFGVMFKTLPDAKIDWRDVWVGATLTALLFTAGKFLIGLYVGRSAVTSVYGAAGSIVVLLLWVYWSSQILFFGAEFTRVYARHHQLPDQTMKLDGKVIETVEDAIDAVLHEKPIDPGPLPITSASSPSPSKDQQAP